MESLDDDEFLAGLAPPGIKATASNSLRRNSGTTAEWASYSPLHCISQQGRAYADRLRHSHADEALPNTPPLAATPGSVLGRKPAADATSTLLNFLKQEQVLVAEQRPQLANFQIQQQSKESTTNTPDEKVLHVAGM